MEDESGAEEEEKILLSVQDEKFEQDEWRFI